jgi:hypothetical protein
MDTQRALRQTSDTLLRDLDALGDLEDEKRRTPQGDPRLVEIAARIEEIAGRVLAASRRQLTLSEAATATIEHGVGDPTATIESMPRNVSLILDEWRAAERAAQAAAPGSVEEHEASSRADRLREEYRDAIDRVQHHFEDEARPG